MFFFTDLSGNRISVDALTDQFGLEFVSRYRGLEATLRRTENYQHQKRVEMVQTIREEVVGTELSDVSGEDFHSDQEEHDEHQHQQVNKIAYKCTHYRKSKWVCLNLKCVLFWFGIKHKQCWVNQNLSYAIPNRSGLD